MGRESRERSGTIILQALVYDIPFFSFLFLKKILYLVVCLIFLFVFVLLFFVIVITCLKKIVPPNAAIINYTIGLEKLVSYRTVFHWCSNGTKFLTDS